MRAFGAGEIDVLVSTTVIEVGVDVGNATTMVILDADRFGISQLHQLRGRVGRGGHPGLCLLVTQAEPGSPARSRLDAVAGTTDGFELADLDLELRREGDVLGTDQSGRRSSLQVLSVVRDVAIVEEAREAASAIVGTTRGWTGTRAWQGWCETCARVTPPTTWRRRDANARDLRKGALSCENTPLTTVRQKRVKNGGLRTSCGLVADWGLRDPLASRRRHEAWQP